MQTADDGDGQDGGNGTGWSDEDLEGLNNFIENMDLGGQTHSGPDNCIAAGPRVPRLSLWEQENVVPYVNAFVESYAEYVNPWTDETESPHTIDWLLSGGTMVFQAIGVTAAIAAVAVEAVTVWTGHTMAASVTSFYGNNLHFAYQVGGRWFHAMGTANPYMVVRWGKATKFGAGNPWWTVTGIPIRNPEAASQSGHTAWPCVNACWQAFARGWTL